MHYNKIIILLVLNSIFFNLYSQSYFLTGNIENSEQNKLIISKYNFNEKVFIDSTTIVNSNIKYNLSALEKGMYNIENKDVSIDFIYNSENIEVLYDAKNSNPVVYKKSIENNIINNFFIFYDTNNLALRLLSQLLNYYPKNDDFFDNIVKRKDLLIKKNNSFIDSISTNYPNTFASEILELYSKTDDDFLNSEYKFSTDLKNTVFLGDLIISYLNEFQKEKISKDEQEKAFKPAIDNIFNGLKKNPDLCVYVSEFLIDQFRYFDFDIISEYIALKTSQLENVNTCVDDTEFNKTFENIKALLNVKLGEIAPNFNISSDKTLHDIKTDYKIVIFWASWCPHCEELFNKMIAKQKDLGENVEIITYSLDSDVNEWKKAISKFPKTWINKCICEDGNEEIPDSYAVYSTPSIFLLDDMNTIIDKPKKLEDVEGLVY